MPMKENECSSHSHAAIELNNPNNTIITIIHVSLSTLFFFLFNIKQKMCDSDLGLC